MNKVRCPESGSALLMSLFFMMLLALLALAFTTLVPVELNAALRDKTAVQGGYTADAGILMFAYGLEDTGGPLPVGATDTVGSHWTWHITDVDESMGTNIYRVTCESRLMGEPQRCVMAVIENEVDSVLINYAFFNDGAGDMNNQNAFWPLSVPIYGDIYFDGIWSADTSEIDLVNGAPADAPVQGVVYFSGNTGPGARQEQYTGGGIPYLPGPPAVEDGDKYSKIYRDGIDGLVPNYPNPGDLVNVDIHREVIGDVLDVSGDAAALDAAEDAHMADVTASTLPMVHVTNDGSGNATGGVYVGNHVRDLEFSVSPTGESLATMVVQKNLSGNPGPTVTWTLTYSAAGDSLRVTSSEAYDEIFVIPPGTESTGVIFIRGDLDSLHTDRGPDGQYGTGDETGHNGRHTVVGDGNVTITGELLKDTSTFPRPATAPGPVPVEEPDADILGIMSGATRTPAGNYGVMSINVTETTPDNIYYMYAPLMGLNKKMFSQATGSDLPDGAQLVSMGQLVVGESNQGQTNTATDFYYDHMFGVFLDPNNQGLPYWPVLGSTTGTPVLRAYVEGPASEMQPLP